MGQFDEFFFEGDLSVRRERILDQPKADIDSSAPTQTKQEITEDYVNSIYDTYRKAIDKANILIPSIEKVAKKYTIRVDERSLEVRRAVSREDQNSNEGEYISFDLFTRIIDIIELQAISVDFDVINTKVFADSLATEREIKSKIDKRLDGDSDLLLVASNILVLFLLHQITGIWRGSEHVSAQPKAAGPYPTEPASSAGEAIREAAVGIAAAQIVLGLNRTLMQRALQDGSVGDVEQIIKGAIGQVDQVKLPPLVEKAKKLIGLEDYKLILKYCIKYITESTDRGYEFWLSYLMVRKTRYQASRNLSLAPMFSNREFAIYNPAIANKFGGLTGGIAGSLAESLANILNASVVAPTDEYLCALDYEATNFETGLNYIAQVLDTKFTKDLICCLVRFFGNVDLDILKKIATILRIALNNNMIDLNATMSNFIGLLVSWVRDTITRLLLGLIQQLLNKLVKLIADFLNDLSGDADFLSECPLILELILAITEGIDAIIDDYEKILKNFTSGVVLNSMSFLGLNDLDATNKGLKPGLLRIHRKRSISRILRILDAIISTLDGNINICNDKSDNINSSQSITYDDILKSPLISDIEDYLDVNQDMKDKYFKDAVEVRFEDGTYIPAYTNGIMDIGKPGGPAPDCGDAFSNSVLAKLLGQYNRQ